MPIGTYNLLAAIVGLERAMVDHALEAIFLYRIALSVQPGPLARLQGILDLRRAPVHQGLALLGRHEHKMSGIVWPGHFPRPTIDLGAIVKGIHQRRLKALQALMLVVIEHAQQPQALVIEGTGY